MGKREACEQDHGMIGAIFLDAPSCRGLPLC